MADQKRLAYSIIQFLHTQLQSGSMSPDAQESLEGGWVDQAKIWENLECFFPLFSAPALPGLLGGAEPGWNFGVNFSFREESGDAGGLPGF